MRPGEAEQGFLGDRRPDQAPEGGGRDWGGGCLHKEQAFPEATHTGLKSRLEVCAQFLFTPGGPPVCSGVMLGRAVENERAVLRELSSGMWAMEGDPKTNSGDGCYSRRARAPREAEASPVLPIAVSSAPETVPGTKRVLDKCRRNGGRSAGGAGTSTATTHEALARAGQQGESFTHAAFAQRSPALAAPGPVLP